MILVVLSIPDESQAASFYRIASIEEVCDPGMVCRTRIFHKLILVCVSRTNEVFYMAVEDRIKMTSPASGVELCPGRYYKAVYSSD